jgi:ubiquinone/menaquinone biosynthesis C-methylase UbiE
MEKRVRLEEEFELETEDQAFADYAYVTSMISVNYSLMADELSRLGNFKDGLAIDIGTGLGDFAIEVSKRYPKLDVIGIDISQKAIAEATKKANFENLGNLSFRIADVHNLPFEDASADLIFSHGSIHHLRDPSQAFFEIYRVLKPSALAYLADLRRDAPQEIIKEIEKNLPPRQAKAFINSVNASYIPQELREMLTKLTINNFQVSDLVFSRETILKNKHKLREASMRSADYIKLSQIIIIKKE